MRALAHALKAPSLSAVGHGNGHNQSLALPFLVMNLQLRLHGTARAGELTAQGPERRTTLRNIPQTDGQNDVTRRGINASELSVPVAHAIIGSEP